MSDIRPRRQPDTLQPIDADLLASEWVRYLASIALTAAATLVAIAVESKVNIPNLSLVFVVPVIIAGVTLGLGPSLCSAILGVLAFNFFLTEPRYSLAVNDPENIWAIVLLFAVGLIASGVAFTSRRRAFEAARLRTQANVLQKYSQDVSAADNANAIASITSQALAALFHVPAVVLLLPMDKWFRFSVSATWSCKRPSWKRHDHRRRPEQLYDAAFIRISVPDLISGLCGQQNARQRSSVSHLNRTSVL